MLILIEGNIAAGKSSLTSALEKELGAKSFQEPLETNPYLQDYYKDPKRWALEMQLFLLAQRVATQNEAIEFIKKTGRPAVIDRSIFGDAVFAKRNWLDGNIDDRGYKTYLQHLDLHVDKLKLDPLIIYLNVKPEVCHDRIVNLRKRSYEAAIPLNYIQGLDECYRQMIDDLISKKYRVIDVDWASFEPLKTILDQIRLRSSESPIL